MPAAVERFPSIPDSPRFAYTSGEAELTGARSRSRIGLEEPANSGSSAPRAAHTAAANAGPVKYGCAASRPSRRSRTIRSAAARLRASYGRLARAV